MKCWWPCWVRARRCCWVLAGDTAEGHVLEDFPSGAVRGVLAKGRIQGGEGLALALLALGEPLPLRRGWWAQ